MISNAGCQGHGSVANSYTLHYHVTITHLMAIGCYSWTVIAAAQDTSIVPALGSFKSATVNWPSFCFYLSFYCLKCCLEHEPFGRRRQ